MLKKISVGPCAQAEERKKKVRRGGRAGRKEESTGGMGRVGVRWGRAGVGGGGGDQKRASLSLRSRAGYSTGDKAVASDAAPHKNFHAITLSATLL